jgi:hypothetical protein
MEEWNGGKRCYKLRVAGYVLSPYKKVRRS